MTSYGKDPKQLIGRPNFRQSMAIGKAANPSSTGRGRPAFLTQFKPALDDGYTDDIRVLYGHYTNRLADDAGNVAEHVLPYFVYVQHYHAGLKKFLQCSAGPLGHLKGKSEPCPSCDLFWQQRAEGRDGPMTRRTVYVFTVLQYGLFAELPQVDRDGRQRINTTTGKPYLEWRLVRPHEKGSVPPNTKTRDGSVLHWTLGQNHLTALEVADRQIGKSCAACGGKDTLSTLHWQCSQCDAPLIDPENTNLTPKQIEDITSHPEGATCNLCDYTGPLKEIVLCSRGCAHPVRADMFGVDLTVNSTKEANGKGTVLHVLSTSAPRPIDKRYEEFAKPMDLPTMFAPTPVEEQERILSGVGARVPVNAGAYARPYAPRPALGQK
jgi:hypothetical protein